MNKVEKGFVYKENETPKATIEYGFAKPQDISKTEKIIMNKRTKIWFLIGFILGLILILSIINFNKPLKEYQGCHRECQKVWGRASILVLVVN